MGSMLEGIGLVYPATQTAREEVDVAALVATYASLLFRVAHSVLRNAAEAEDVVQDAFVRVLEHKRTLPEIREMRVWLVRIAWNLSLDRRRRIRPAQMEEGFVEGLVSRTAGAETQLSAAREMKMVLDEMDRLPKGERQVLLLSAVEELGTAEIAAVMGKSESGVRALLFRARQRLRERMEHRINRGGRA